MKRYKLGEIAKIYNGSTPTSTNSEYYGGDIVWITPKDLSDQNVKYIEYGERSITEAGYNSCSTTLIPAGNILMSSRAPIGLLAINKVDCCTNQGFKNIVVNKKLANTEYIYYFLMKNMEAIKRLSGGTTFQEISKETLQQLEFDLPDLSEQQRIAKILSTIDAKIELNKKISRELEAMAKELYDYWFVQFEFPNEQGKPYKSSGGKMVWNEQLKREIPKGWKVTNIGNLTTVVTGKEDANFSSPNGKYKFFTCSQEALLCDTPAFSGQAVLIAGNGDFNVKHYSGEFNAYQRTYVLIPENQAYYGAMYISAKNQIQAFKNGSNGSIVKFITKGDVENIPFILPNDDSIFYQINKLIEKIELCERENEELTKLRDWLLPMLMNGQARVE